MAPSYSRTVWIDYLRSGITVLVVAHHSALSYTTYSTFNKYAYILSTHPVVDAHRWAQLDIFTSFNDIFMMPLMFLVSGIFVGPAIEKKGAAAFIRDRFYRLFIPFVLGVTVLMLLAYYPAWYIGHGNNDIKAYITDFFTTEAWPVGPPWFLWVLFLFDVFFALVYPLIRNFVDRCSRWLASLQNKSWALLLFWFLFTWILYIPLRLYFGPFSWTGIGPFDFQLSRPLLYFGYFFLGVLLGKVPLREGLFSSTSTLPKNWLIWLMLCPAIFIVLNISAGKITGEIIYGSLYVLSIVCTCLGLLALFSKKVTAPKSWWNSLSANAYSIYLLHYIFVVWFQFFLLPVNIPAGIKFFIVLAMALGASWLVSCLIRKNALIARYL